MLQDSPNLIFILGFVNASWKLSAETMSMLLVRLWQHMRPRGARVAVTAREAKSSKHRILISCCILPKRVQCIPKRRLYAMESEEEPHC